MYFNNEGILEKMKFKKWLALPLCLCLSTTIVCAADRADVYVNNQKLASDAYLINDRVYVPLRAVSETMGASVSWNDAQNSAYITFDEDTLVSSVINNCSESVVAIAGNYTPEYISKQALSYNNAYAHGTGVVIKSSGVILTNYHVVENMENITVVLGSGESYSGVVQYADKLSDLAVVKINKLGLKPITFAKEADIQTGRTVIAIGTPLSLGMMNSASKGIISGTHVNIGEHYAFLQSDVSINGGNSGGALVNLKGELVGITTEKFAGIGIEGMSFAIPIGTVNYVLHQFETNGKVLRPEIPVTYAESWEAKIGLPTTKGLTVSTSAVPEIQQGDILNAVNGVSVHSITDYNEALKSTFSASLTLSLTRGGQPVTVTLSPSLK